MADPDISLYDAMVRTFKALRDNAHATPLTVVVPTIALRPDIYDWMVGRGYIENYELTESGSAWLFGGMVTAMPIPHYRFEDFIPMEDEDGTEFTEDSED